MEAQRQKLQDEKLKLRMKEYNEKKNEAIAKLGGNITHTKYSGYLGESAIPSNPLHNDVSRTQYSAR